jgi:hypothetical protein
VATPPFQIVGFSSIPRVIWLSKYGYWHEHVQIEVNKEKKIVVLLECQMIL